MQSEDKKSDQQEEFEFSEEQNSKSPEPGANSKTAKFEVDESQNASIHNPQSLISESLRESSAMPTNETFLNDRVLSNHSELISNFGKSFDALSQNSDYESKKAEILQGMLKALKQFKETEFEDENSRDIVKNVL